ncbi:MAG: hypothetical protein HZA51_05060 [Planctomycetes bacterium]|nr:hypothetical protein [Planctomycetota bacterium]
MTTKRRSSRKPGGAAKAASATRAVGARRKPAARRRRSKIRASTTAQKNTPAGGLRVLFPKLANAKNRFGLGFAMVRAVRDGGPPKYQITRREEACQKPAMRPRAALTARIDAGRTAGQLGGLAHPDRIRLAIAMMTGADTHMKLSTETRLAAGPLYHHLRAMQLAGLVHQPSRNFYTLTEQGETLLLITACIS